MNSITKQCLGYFKNNKLNVIIISLLVFLTSFMYFFVECSIDTNKAALLKKGNLVENEQAFMVALNSNTTLALSFYLFLLGVTAFVFYMFYKKNYELNKNYIGCIRSLGFTNGTIASVYMAISACVGLVFSLLGLGLGYVFSFILLNNYVQSYHVDNPVRGLAFTSFLLGVVLLTAVICLITLIAYLPYKKKDITEMFTDSVVIIKNNWYGRLADKIASRIPSRNSFSIRLALRKPFNLILILVSVSVYLVLIIMGVSLNKSSDKIFKDMQEGRDYKYQLIFEEMQSKNDFDGAEAFVRVQADVCSVDLNTKEREPIETQYVYAIQSNHERFSLRNKKGELINISEGYAVVNERFAYVYGFEPGDVIAVSLGENFYQFTISEVASNGNADCIYVDYKDWNNITDNKGFNGIWCKELPEELKDASGVTIQTWDDYIQFLNDNNVSNRISAVINQVLGVVFGLLLIFLALLLNFQDNTHNYIYLEKLGYMQRDIKNMLINIYLPIVVAAFIISILPAILICKRILRGLSLATGDYMPFITNPGILLYALVLLMLIYFLVLAVFDLRLKKQLKAIKDGE